MGYSLWGCKELDTIEHAHTHPLILTAHPLLQLRVLEADLNGSCSPTSGTSSPLCTCKPGSRDASSSVSTGRFQFIRHCLQEHKRLVIHSHWLATA